MCNLSEIILEKGIEIGIEKGIETGIKQGIAKEKNQTLYRLVQKDSSDTSDLDPNKM